MSENCIYESQLFLLIEIKIKMRQHFVLTQSGVFVISVIVNTNTQGA